MNLKKFAQTEYFFLLILLVVSIGIMMPVLIQGIPFGYDLPHHYQCVLTFVDSIRDGVLYPSWSLNRNFGFGGIEARLYPPLSHYSLALAYLLIGDWHIASWITFTFFTFLGGLGVYLWAKEYMPSNQAVFAGCIFNLLPYHLNQLYNTFFYAEFVGTALLPFVFLFISRVSRRGKFIDIIGLIVSYALLILTHLPLTVIGSICFFIYALTLLKREKIVSQVFKLSIGVIGGLFASSFFWIKVLLEKDLMARTLIYAEPFFDYRLHFLFTPIQRFEGELPNRVYETATFYYDLMFLCAIVLALSCTIPFLIWEKRKKTDISRLWGLFGLSVFLATPLSRFVWDFLPFLQNVQFPWRWLTIVSIVSSIIAASQLNFLISWFSDKKRPVGLIICGCILAVITFSLNHIVRQSPFIEKTTTTEYLEKETKDVGLTFWWTIWAKKEAFNNKEQVLVEHRNVKIQDWNATNREFQIEEGVETQARIATFYHPDWKAEVNNSPVELKPDENGAILIPIPPQTANVKLYFLEPFVIKLWQKISLVIWILIFFSLIFLKLRKKSNLQNAF